MPDPDPIIGPFPHWDDPFWDRSVRLLEAIRLWFPTFARLLDQVKWISPDEIRGLAQQHQESRYDYPASVRARRMEAERQRDGDADSCADPPIESGDNLADSGIPDLLQDDWARLLREWDQWDDHKRLIRGFELAASLIIEKTRHGQHYILKIAPPVSGDGLGGDYQRVGEPQHDGLGPYDFDLGNSMIKRRGGNWLSARILGGIGAEGERAHVAHLAREAREAVAAGAWAALRSAKMRDRQLFGYDEVANGLSRKSGSLEIDTAERDHILHNLNDRTRRGEFELGGESDVVILIDEPPYFTPLRPMPPLSPLAVEVSIAPDMRMLRRGACRRYVENSSLEGAQRLLREWFPEAFEPGVNSLNREYNGGNNRLYLKTNSQAKASATGRQRAGYSNALEFWIAHQQLTVLQRMGPAAISRQFKSHCEQHLPGVVPLLPQRLRSMENVIQRIISRRRESARSNNSGSSASNNGQ